MLHRESRATSTRRAQAQLLIDKIRKKIDDAELRDNFLGYPVRDLSTTVSPWRSVLDWRDIEVTPNEE